jgi:Uma2 family endonuclease
MATVISPPPRRIQTLADLLDRLGGVPPNRVRWRPLPGLATEEDVIDADCHEDRLCELVDGTLVEKAMGYLESTLACYLIRVLKEYVDPRNLGLVSGESGMMSLVPGQVRIPDVAFASWKRFPDRKMPKEPIPSLVPDLAIEVLSESNTKREMARKYREYFQAGVQLVWEVDPKNRTVEVFTAADQSTRLNENQTLDGGNVLPGFTLSLSQLFGELDRQGKG